MVEISSHFALISWINRCEMSPWLFLIHLRIGDGRRGSSNVLPVCCCPFHILYCRFCCISKFFSGLAHSPTVTVLSCDWDPNRVNIHTCYCSLLIGTQTVSICDSCCHVIAIPTDSFCICRSCLVIRTFTDSVCLCSLLSCDWDSKRLSPSALLGLWLGPRQAHSASLGLLTSISYGYRLVTVHIVAPPLMTVVSVSLRPSAVGGASFSCLFETMLLPAEVTRWMSESVRRGVGVSPWPRRHLVARDVRGKCSRLSGDFFCGLRKLTSLYSDTLSGRVWA
jgi:hypothetical protein